MKRLDFFKTLSIFIFLLLITQISVNAQIDIKSKVDAETYANYSKAIDLFEKNLNPNDVVTLFIPINYSFTRLSQEKQSALLNNISKTQCFSIPKPFEKLFLQQCLRKEKTLTN